MRRAIAGGVTVATLWLDRPEKLNALHRVLWKSIPAAVASLDEDPDVRAIVLAGRGKAFCAGSDLVDHAPSMASGGSLSGRGESVVGKRRALLACRPSGDSQGDHTYRDLNILCRICAT